MISKIGPESWFEQRPKVIVEDDERPKVVVVEDDALLRRKVSADLRSEGFQVLEAATAHEAFLLFKSVPDVGVVMSDRRVIGVRKDDALVGMPAFVTAAIECLKQRTQTKPCFCRTTPTPRSMWS
jgi:CheY-like chemotaxis protein